MYGGNVCEEAASGVRVGVLARSETVGLPPTGVSRRAEVRLYVRVSLRGAAVPKEVPRKGWVEEGRVGSVRLSAPRKPVVSQREHANDFRP